MWKNVQTARTKQCNKDSTENATRHIWEATHQKTQELQHFRKTRGKTKKPAKQGKRNDKKRSLKERAKMAKYARCQFWQYKTQNARKDRGKKEYAREMRFSPGGDSYRGCLFPIEGAISWLRLCTRLQQRLDENIEASLSHPVEDRCRLLKNAEEKLNKHSGKTVWCLNVFKRFLKELSFVTDRSHT